jgi:hypothetical protein
MVVTTAPPCCEMFCISLFVLFALAIAMSTLLWFTASGYPFGIFKLFVSKKKGYYAASNNDYQNEQ